MNLREQSADRQEARSPTPRRSFIDIGLDFGTHSTKVVVRRRGENAAFVVAADEPTTGFPWYVTPSLVHVADGKVSFGSVCRTQNVGHVGSSLKVRLRPLAKTRTYAVGEPTAELLVTCYLTWVLGRVRAWIIQRFGDGHAITLNLGAPMIHYAEDEDPENRPNDYLRILQAAWESTFGDARITIDQGASLDELTHHFGHFLGDDFEIPDRSIRTFDVMPETIAPIISLARDPRMGPGMHMIFDMGASTTEVSINRIGERTAMQTVQDQKIVCYFDESEVLGGNDFEIADQCSPAERSSELMRLLGVTKKHYETVWQKGYEKDNQSPAARPKWLSLRVLLVGGGARREEVENLVRTQHPIWIADVQGDKPSYRVEWYGPANIEGERDSSRVQFSSAEASLLAVADGLAYPRRQWQEHFIPFQVERLPPAEVVEKPSANWYLDDNR